MRAVSQGEVEISQDAAITINEALIVAASVPFPIGKSTLQRWAKHWAEQGTASPVKCVLVTNRFGVSYRIDRDDFEAWAFAFRASRPFTHVCYNSFMTVTLPPNQRQWLEAQVAAGRFSSVEDAVQHAVADMMMLSADDFEWARPYIEAADASLARGEGISADKVFQNWSEHLKASR